MVWAICESVTGTAVKHAKLVWVENIDLKVLFELHFEFVFLPPGVSPASRPSPGTPASPGNLSSGLKTPAPATTASHNPLANILSKVEITPESILSALSKTQTQSAPALQGKLTCARGLGWWVCPWHSPRFHFSGIQSREMYRIQLIHYSLHVCLSSTTW